MPNFTAVDCVRFIIKDERHPNQSVIGKLFKFMLQEEVYPLTSSSAPGYWTGDFIPDAAEKVKKLLLNNEATETKE